MMLPDLLNDIVIVTENILENKCIQLNRRLINTTYKETQRAYGL